MAISLGQDISAYQGQVNFDVYKNNANFVIVKASEGVSFTDAQFYRNQSEARRVGLPLGYYHFARPDLGNDPAHEADWFLKVIGTPQEGEVLCLDYEVTYADPVGWCKTFLDRVKFMTQGCSPLIYLNQSLTKNYDWTPVVNANYGLWLASYTFDPNTNTGDTGKWPAMAMQQWTNNQSVPGIYGFIDGDVFFGDIEQFKKYGYHTPVVPEPAPVGDSTGSQTPSETTVVNSGTTTASPTPPSIPPPVAVVDYKSYLERIGKAAHEPNPWWYAFVSDNRLTEIKEILDEIGV